MLDTPSTRAIVALGANLPFLGRPPEAILQAVYAEWMAEGLNIIEQSSFWGTLAYPRGSGPDYVNAVVVLEAGSLRESTSWLQYMHQIEAKFGRERQKRWGGRTLDIDLIAMGDSVLPNAEVHDHWRNLSPDLQAQLAPQELILPHPRMQDRAFVLAPMAEVAPEWRHPRLGLTTVEMLAALPEEERRSVWKLPCDQTPRSL